MKKRWLKVMSDFIKWRKAYYHKRAKTHPEEYPDYRRVKRMKDDTLKIDIPIVDAAFMRKVIINGKEKNIGRLTKWSLILEVNHLPRIEAIVERPLEKEFLPRETYKERTR